MKPAPASSAHSRDWEPEGERHPFGFTTWDSKRSTLLESRGEKRRDASGGYLREPRVVPFSAD